MPQKRQGSFKKRRMYYIIILIWGVILGRGVNILISCILKESTAMEFSYRKYSGRKPVPDYILEVINGLTYVFIFIYNGFGHLSIMYCLVFSVFLVISVVDFKTYHIPFCMNIVIFIMATIRLILEPDVIENNIIGLFAVSGFMIFCLVMGRIFKGEDVFGGGDIKLMAAAGLLLGVEKVILGFLLGCILCGVIHITRMALFGASRVFALGPYLCGGLFAAMIFENRLMEWYNM